MMITRFASARHFIWRIAVSRPARTAAGARRGEARAEVHPGAEGPRRAREVHDGGGRVGRRLVHDGNRLGPGRGEELLQGLLRRRVGGWHRLRHVLEGEDLPPPRLAEARGPARSDPEAGPHAEAEAAPGAEHVEEDEQAEDAVRHRRDPDAGRQTPRARTRAGVVYHRSRARNARAWTRLSATSLRAWSRMTSR